MSKSLAIGLLILSIACLNGGRPGAAITALPLISDQSFQDRRDNLERIWKTVADNYYDPDFNGGEIARTSIRQCAGLPRLKDVVARYWDRGFLDIELKVPGLERITAALLRKHPPQRGCVVSSFLPGVIHACHAEDSSIALGLICDTRRETEQWNQVPVEYVIPHYRLLDRARP